MTAVLPNGYVTILEAADLLARSMYAGVPNMLVITRLRKEGLNVRDGWARNRAIAEIWKAVDEGRLRAMAIGGRPRRILRLSPYLTTRIPGLRDPRGRGFTQLRQSNAYYHQFASWFGSLPHSAVLAFRESEIEKLASRLMRARRTTEKTNGTKRRGRPSRIVLVQPLISQLVAQKKWTPTRGMKALAREVNRAGTWPKSVSQDTVTRALDLLFVQTDDRRFERILHTRRARKASRSK
jgi:hypothetical protein